MFEFNRLPDSIIRIILSYLEKPPRPPHTKPISDVLYDIDDMVEYVDGKRLVFDNRIIPMVTNPSNHYSFMIRHNHSLVKRNIGMELFSLWAKNIIENKLPITEDKEFILKLYKGEIEPNVYNNIITRVKWNYSPR